MTLYIATCIAIGDVIVYCLDPIKYSKSCSYIIAKIFSVFIAYIYSDIVYGYIYSDTMCSYMYSDTVYSYMYSDTV